MTVELNKETIAYLKRLVKRGGHEGEQARDVLKAAGLYDDDFIAKEEERDEHGRWTSGGDSSSGNSRGDLSGKYTPADYGADPKYSGEIKAAQEAMKNGVTPEEFKTKNAAEQIKSATGRITTSPFLDEGQRRDTVSGHRAAAGALREAAKITSDAGKKAAFERAASLHDKAYEAHGRVFIKQDSGVSDTTKYERSAFNATQKAMDATKGLM